MNSERQLQAFRNDAENGESANPASLAPHLRNAAAPGSVSIQGSKSPENEKKCFFQTNPISPSPRKSKNVQTNLRSDYKQRNALERAAASRVLRTRPRTLYNCFPASLDKNAE
jgi:hypothetical protein